MKVADIKNTKTQATMNSDVYVPVSIRYDDYKPNPLDFLFEYRYFSNNNSYIEIAVNNKDKEIKRITMHTISGVQLELEENFNDISCIEGIPIIEVNEKNWNDLGYCQLLDVKNNFSVYYINQRFIVLFENHSGISKRIKMPYAELLVNASNDVMGLIIYDIPEATAFRQNILLNSNQ